VRTATEGEKPFGTCALGNAAESEQNSGCCSAASSAWRPGGRGDGAAAGHAPDTRGCCVALDKCASPIVSAAPILHS